MIGGLHGGFSRNLGCMGWGLHGASSDGPGEDRWTDILYPIYSVLEAGAALLHVGIPCRRSVRRRVALSGQRWSGIGVKRVNIKHRIQRLTFKF